MKSIAPLLLLLLVVWTPVRAQVIQVDPPFPTVGDEVTLTFDAAEGSGGLANCGCDVYIHTGLITSASTNPSDWQYVVTEWGEEEPDWQLQPVPGSDNLYTFTISPSIASFYGVPEGEEVLQLAFVFRDGPGNREGKAGDGGDIYYDVAADDQPFTTLLQQPEARFLVVPRGESLPVAAVASQEATFSLFRGETLLVESTGTSFAYELEAEDFGNFDLTLRIAAGPDVVEYDLRYVVPAGNPPSPPPAGTRPGAQIVADDKLRLLLEAPGKGRVFVLGDFNAWTLDTAFQMRPTLDGRFWLEVEGIEAGETLRYQYLIDESLLLADPYSTLVLDPFNDGFIPETVYPDLPAYPEGETTGLVSVIEAGAEDYDWATEDFEAPPDEELVVYELVLRDFLEDHSYATLLDSLSYLDLLGVNAIELMPISEFEGNISWGYNPSFHNAVDKYYGPADALKRLVDSAHARGIAVILDIVYNQAFGQSPLVQMYWDATNNRPAPDNPWFNVVPLHPFAVGYDFDHSYPGTREYVKYGLQRWLTEFRIDGFRFDQSKGFTQRQTTDVGAWGAYDPQRVAWIKEYADYIWAINPDAYVILEHFADAQEEKELTDYGMMSWAGGLHNEYKEAAMGYASDFSRASWKNLGWSGPRLMAYMESHDEERMMFQNLNFGNSSGDYDVTDFETALDRVKLASTFFYTVPGPKMLWEFGELGYDYTLFLCSDGEVRDNCNIDPKPIRWDYFEDPARQALFDVTKDLIYLKTEFEVFNTDDFELLTERDDWKKIYLYGDDMDVAVLGNFDLEPVSVPDPFPSDGKWYEYFSGDSLQVVDPTAPLALEAGAYRLYTTERIARPRGISTSTYEVVRDVFELDVYPNPGRGPITVAYRLQRGAPVRIDLFNMLGQPVATTIPGRQPAGLHQQELAPDAPPGTYLLRLTVGRQVESTLLVLDGR